MHQHILLVTHQGKSPGERWRRLQRRDFLSAASQKVQSGSPPRLAFCGRITPPRSYSYSSTRPANYSNTMDIPDCPFRKKRRPLRMDFSSFVLVIVALALCQTTLAGETLYNSDKICGTFSARLELHLCFFVILCLTSSSSLCLIGLTVCVMNTRIIHYRTVAHLTCFFRFSSKNVVNNTPQRWAPRYPNM